jgi:hypothetical protein
MPVMTDCERVGSLCTLQSEKDGGRVSCSWEAAQCIGYIKSMAAVGKLPQEISFNVSTGDMEKVCRPIVTNTDGLKNKEVHIGPQKCSPFPLRDCRRLNSSTTTWCSLWTLSKSR